MYAADTPRAAMTSIHPIPPPLRSRSFSLPPSPKAKFRFRFRGVHVRRHVRQEDSKTRCSQTSQHSTKEAELASHPFLFSFFCCCFPFPPRLVLVRAETRWRSTTPTCWAPRLKDRAGTGACAAGSWPCSAFTEMIQALPRGCFCCVTGGVFGRCGDGLVRQLCRVQRYSASKRHFVLNRRVLWEAERGKTATGSAPVCAGKQQQ